ncbi:MAG: hypothetical protein AAFY54_12855 [Cyanobacteria bacterium J06648_10]
MTYNPTVENSFFPSPENIKAALADVYQVESTRARPISTEPTFSNVLPPISQTEKDKLVEEMIHWILN